MLSDVIPMVKLEPTPRERGMLPGTRALLIGAVILNVDARECMGVVCPVITIKTAAGKLVRLTVQSDPEGNDGGWIEAEVVR